MTALRELPPPQSEINPGSPTKNRLLAISPMEGRYGKDTEILAPFMSEWGLMRARVFVETELLKAYSEAKLIPALQTEETDFLNSLSADFDLIAGDRIKQIEKTSEHDVVAVVSFMKEELIRKGFGHLAESVHLGPTSEDIDNIAIRLNLLAARDAVMIPALNKTLSTLTAFATGAKDTPMIGRTHGQPAAVTTFGREMEIFAARLQRQRDKLQTFQFQGKMNGIIGTFSGFRAAFPEKSLEWWMQFSDEFVRSFGLEPLAITAQGNPNDDLAENLQIYQRINNILHGFESDIWDYISRKLIKQKPKGAGSSTGAAKVNPWRAEHAQAMEEMASGMMQTLIGNVQESRLDRDLSDKTLMRFLGEIMAITLNGWQYTTKQIELLEPVAENMRQTIFTDVAFLAEALQLRLRKAGVENAYDLIRKKTQGKEFAPEEWAVMVEEIIAELKLEDAEFISDLQLLSPQQFIGDAIALTQIGIEGLSS